MKAILMCAGRSTRTLPITERTPKPLLKILNKSIIMHTLDQLVGSIDTAIVVVGYLKESLIRHLGTTYNGIEIRYEMQETLSGTGDAVYSCREHFFYDEKFLVLNGDDLYSKSDIDRLIVQESLGILAMKVVDPSHYGVLQMDESFNLIKIVEKPKIYIGDFVNAGCYYLDYKIFDYLKETQRSERGEVELTSAVHALALNEQAKIKVVPIQDHWLPINYPSSYLKANVWALNSSFACLEQHDSYSVDKNIILKGNIHLGKNSVLEPFTYIEGPAFIGDNCHIDSFTHIGANTVIMSNCEISRSTIKGSLVLDDSTISGESLISCISDGDKIKFHVK